MRSALDVVSCSQPHIQRPLASNQQQKRHCIFTIKKYDLRIEAKANSAAREALVSVWLPAAVAKRGRSAIEQQQRPQGCCCQARGGSSSSDVSKLSKLPQTMRAVLGSAAARADVTLLFFLILHCQEVVVFLYLARVLV